MKWTEDEIKVVKRGIKQNCIAKDLLDLLPNRSHQAIAHKIYALNPKGKAKPLPWTDEEITILKNGLENNQVSLYYWKEVFPYRTAESIKAKMRVVRTSRDFKAPCVKRAINWDAIIVKEEEQCELEKDRSSATPIRAVSLD